MVVVYTDGSASPNPGPGGFSVIDEETKEPLILGRSDRTTNIKMEGEAILAAMEKFDEVEIYTDSEFWVNVLTKWSIAWAANNWQKKGGKIKNLRLVKKMYAVYNSKRVRLNWTRGHIGTELNEKADEWANKARKRITYKGLEIKEIEPMKEDE
ncbi:ribonuclease HI [Candidatus Saccharibacteria bacterium]|jgi:ribonuclease HI|nr:ribonuclease HI [Candidatus Saccharibacteria bacterium]